jgi:FkbM family methyltransferase
MLRRGAGLVKLGVPGTEHVVFARPDTSDLASFDHVFGGAYALELPHDPRLIFDLGANAGYAAVYFALRWPRVRVLAVEPDPSNAALARRNTAPLPQIDVVEGAVWPRREQLVVEDVGKGAWGMRVRESGEGRRVNAVTIAELFERVGADWVDLVKIDIEGSELALFSEQTDWIPRVGALVLELHDRFRPGCRDAVERALAGSGVSFRELRHDEDVVFIREDG